MKLKCRVCRQSLYFQKRLVQKSSVHVRHSTAAMFICTALPRKYMTNCIQLPFIVQFRPCSLQSDSPVVWNAALWQSCMFAHKVAGLLRMQDQFCLNSQVNINFDHYAVLTVSPWNWATFYLLLFGLLIFLSGDGPLTYISLIIQYQYSASQIGIFFLVQTA